MTDVVTLQAWLIEAETARHKLATGSLRQTVIYNGQQVTFVKTEIGALDAYIASLRSQIAALTENSAASRTAPIRLTF